MSIFMAAKRFPMRSIYRLCERKVRGQRLGGLTQRMLPGRGGPGGSAPTNNAQIVSQGQFMSPQNGLGKNPPFSNQPPTSLHWNGSFFLNANIMIATAIVVVLEHIAFLILVLIEVNTKTINQYNILSLNASICQDPEHRRFYTTVGYVMKSFSHFSNM